LFFDFSTSVPPMSKKTALMFVFKKLFLSNNQDQ